MGWLAQQQQVNKIREREIKIYLAAIGKYLFTIGNNRKVNNYFLCLCLCVYPRVAGATAAGSVFRVWGLVQGFVFRVHGVAGTKVEVFRV
jgi:hypothetical protein